MNNKTFGTFAEKEAAEILTKQGYEILSINERYKSGEIDLIAKHKDTVVFVEVKARVSGKFGAPFEAVTVFKQQRLRRLAELYLLRQYKTTAIRCRFDVFSFVYGNGKRDVTHIKNAF